MRHNRRQPDWNSREPLTRDELRRIEEIAHGAERPIIAGPGHSFSGHFGISMDTTPDVSGFWAEITGKQTIGPKYSFREVQVNSFTSTQVTWTVVDSGVTGTETAYEANDDDGVEVGAVVWMLLADHADEGETGAAEYVFFAGGSSISNVFVWNGDEITIIDIISNNLVITGGPFISVITPTPPGGSSGGTVVTGIVSITNGVLILHNRGPEDFVILHDDSRSAASNRFHTWTKSEQVLKACNSVIIYHDAFLDRWLVLDDSNAYEWWHIDRETLDESKDDWDPSHCTSVYIDTLTSGDFDISGVVDREDGGLLHLYNESTSTITVNNESMMSVADNRFRHPDLKDHLLKQYETGIYQYDATAGEPLVGGGGRHVLIASNALFRESGDLAQRGLVPKPPDTEGYVLFLSERHTTADSQWKPATVACEITAAKSGIYWPAKTKVWTGAYVDGGVGDCLLHLQVEPRGVAIGDIFVSCQWLEKDSATGLFVFGSRDKDTQLDPDSGIGSGHEEGSLSTTITNATPVDDVDLNQTPTADRFVVDATGGKEGWYHVFAYSFFDGSHAAIDIFELAIKENGADIARVHKRDVADGTVRRHLNASMAVRLTTTDYIQIEVKHDASGGLMAGHSTTVTTRWGITWLGTNASLL